jgi:hypothetical protein
MRKQKAGLTRRSLLAGAACAMAFPPTSILADDLGGDSLSGAIAGSLAKSAASSAGSYVFGRLLESAGIDLSGQDEMNAKLDQILQQLKQIENDLTALKKSLNLKFGQLDYDEVTNPIEPIISLNGALNIKYKNLASSTDLAEIRSLKEEIRTALYGPNDLDAAMETWHNSMCGFNGNTSIIKAWEWLFTTTIRCSVSRPRRLFKKTGSGSTLSRR